MSLFDLKHCGATYGTGEKQLNGSYSHMSTILLQYTNCLGRASSKICKHLESLQVQPNCSEFSAKFSEKSKTRRTCTSARVTDRATALKLPIQRVNDAALQSVGRELITRRHTLTYTKTLRGKTDDHIKQNAE